MERFACCSKWVQCKETEKCLHDSEFEKACYLAYNYSQGFNPFKKSSTEQKPNKQKPKKDSKKISLLDFME